MSRFSLHKSNWFCLSLLVLAPATSGAGVEMPFDVGASATPLAPAWCIAPMDPSNPATSDLNAWVPDPPTPPEGCSLYGPSSEWGIQSTSVKYSADNSTWTNAPDNSFSAWIVQSGETPDTATLNVVYYIGGYWQFPCVIGISYNDGSCNDTWLGTATAVATGQSVSLTSLTVVSGATQTNVNQPNGLGSSNWAAVMTKPGDLVIVQATTLPNNTDGWAYLQWTGGNAVAGSSNQRSVDKGTSAATTVTAQIGKTQYSVSVWIIWATVTIQIGGNLASDNNAPMLQGGNWPSNLGGGTALGAIDSDSDAELTYAYTVGRMQATGKLTPPGIGQIITKTLPDQTSTWKFRRLRENISWDNGGHYTTQGNPTSWAAGPSTNAPDWTNDTSNASYSDLDPTSGGSVDTIYDTDAPGCSTVLGMTIYHTSEVYVDFNQYVTVTLDAETPCSYGTYWSYQARVDGDKPVGLRIISNQLSTALIDLPNNPPKPFFDPR